MFVPSSVDLSIWFLVHLSIRHAAVPVFNLAHPFQSPSAVYFIIFHNSSFITPQLLDLTLITDFVHLRSSHSGRVIVGCPLTQLQPDYSFCALLPYTVKNEWAAYLVEHVSHEAESLTVLFFVNWVWPLATCHPLPLFLFPITFAKKKTQKRKSELIRDLISVLDALTSP